MLERAQAKGYAVPAFNFHNLETAQAAVAAAVEMRSPLILAATPSTMDYSGLPYIQAIVEVAAKINDIPIALHLDHHKTVESIKEALEAGVKSVMIDASSKSYEENIALSKEVAEMAHSYGATVEAELGKIIEQTDGSDTHAEDQYTDPDVAKEFVAKTNVDSLAVSIGTGHGVYETEPNLDFNRLKDIRSKVDVPLVLHGASGISKQDLQKCIELGCTKVNISTELKIPFAKVLRQYLIDHPMASDIRTYMRPSKQVMKELAMDKIIICRSQNQA